MHFLDFKLQAVCVQAHLICRQGVYLSERKEGDYFIALYALNDYYVEVYYRCQDSEIIMITSFYNTALLDPYLKKIKLEKLFPVALYQ
jgi:hypothetical protein